MRKPVKATVNKIHKKETSKAQRSLKFSAKIVYENIILKNSKQKPLNNCNWESINNLMQVPTLPLN